MQTRFGLPFSIWERGLRYCDDARGNAIRLPRKETAAICRTCRNQYICCERVLLHNTFSSESLCEAGIWDIYINGFAGGPHAKNSLTLPLNRVVLLLQYYLKISLIWKLSKFEYQCSVLPHSTSAIQCSHAGKKNICVDQNTCE